MRTQWLVLAGICLAGLALGAAAWWGYRPFMNAATDWQIERALAQAGEAAEAGQWKTVREKAWVAYELGRGRDIEALRRLLDAAFELRDQRMLAVARALFLHPDSTLRDKARSLELVILAGDYGAAREMLGQLSQSQREQADILLQRARYLAARGGKDEALRLLLDYLKEHGKDDRRFPLLFADLALSGKMNPVYLAQAQAAIGYLMERQDDVALQAFRLFRRLPASLLRRDDLPRDLRQWVETHPGHGPADVLIAASFDLAEADSADAREAVAARVAKERGENQPGEVARWLNRSGFFEQTLTLLDEDAGRENAEAYLMRLQALLVTERYEDAEAWMKAPHPGVAPVRIAGLRATLASRQGKRAEAVQRWRDAFEEVKVTGRASTFVTLGKMALRAGEREWASRCFHEAARSGRKVLPPAEQSLPILDYLMEEERLRDAMELNARLLLRDVYHPLVRNNFAYLNLLEDLDLERALMISGELVEEFPRSPSLRTTRALALLKNGRPEEALQVLEAEEIEWRTATASDQALRALVLRANGKAEAAAEIRERLDLSELYPAERELLGW